MVPELPAILVLPAAPYMYNTKLKKKPHTFKAVVFRELFSDKVLFGTKTGKAHFDSKTKTV